MYITASSYREGKSLEFHAMLVSPSVKQSGPKGRRRKLCSGVHGYILKNHIKIDPKSAFLIAATLDIPVLRELSILKFPSDGSSAAY